MDDLTFRDLVDDIRDRTDIVRLIGETVEMKRGGSVLRGRSLRNRDKTPSLVVWPRTQTWRDFSGGGAEGGDCFDFLAYRDSISFMDALRSLASRAGVEMPGQGGAQGLEFTPRIAHNAAAYGSTVDRQRRKCTGFAPAGCRAFGTNSTGNDESGISRHRARAALGHPRQRTSSRGQPDVGGRRIHTVGQPPVAAHTSAAANRSACGACGRRSGPS